MLMSLGRAEGSGLSRLQMSSWDAEHHAGALGRQTRAATGAWALIKDHKATAAASPGRVATQ